MEIDTRNNWIILRFRFGETELRSGLQPLWVAYEDDSGERRLMSRASTRLALRTGWHLWQSPFLFSYEFNSTFHIIAPSDLDELVKKSISRQQASPNRVAPISLPVFVQAPLNFEAFKFHGKMGWEEIASYLLNDFGNDQTQIVRLSSKNKAAKRTQFTLPFRVLAIGETCRQYTESLRHSGWYRESVEVRNHGIVFGDYSPKEITAELFKNQWDIILTGEEALEKVLALTEKIPVKSNARPRLIIFFGDRRHEFAIKKLNIPSGTTFLWIPTDFFNSVSPFAASFVNQFFYEIIHDKPLHEAFRLAAQEIQLSVDETKPLFISDPNSNNSLRISDALTNLEAQETKIRKWRKLGELELFLERTGSELNSSLKERLQSVASSKHNIAEAVEKFQNSTFDFTSENRGLVPLSLAAEALSVAKREDAKIRKTVAAIVRNASFVREIRNFQERRVDVTLSRLIADSNYESIDGSKPLNCGARYRVQVHVGHRAEESLVIGDVPPVDPLLPDSKDGHRLEIAFFEKDFTALSDTVQPLFLPRAGGSEPVFFEVRAPEKEGIAEARIGVYHQNHLLQSFLLTANVTSGEFIMNPLKIKLFVAAGEGDSEAAEGRWIETETDKQILAHLVFTRTARFSNLEELGRREISIGLNSGASGTGHTFMVKMDGSAQSINMTEAILQQQTERFRSFLTQNLADAQNLPLFPTRPKPGDESAENFKSAVRTLIEIGAELYDKLFTSVSPDMQNKLRGLAAATDETIQIIRYDHNYVFPWLTLYDYQLPTKITGAAPPPVCLGFAQPTNSGIGTFSSSGDAPVKKCSHKWTDEVYCIYGLWGLRHRVEQLVDLTGEIKDAVTKIVPAGSSVVQLAVGTKDNYTDELVKEMDKALGASFKEFDSTQDLIDLLWNDTNRPAILVVLGHQQIQKVETEPDEPRIVLVPNKKWFLASSISKRLKITRRWSQQPSTLVLLMACSSGATEVSTLNNFVSSLTSAGAGAVAGTECLVFSSMAARFAREVTVDMWNGKSLGEAVKLFYRRLMTAGNPLAFAFNYLGDADIAIEKNSLGL